MPTYKYRCDTCKIEYEQWHSIHADNIGYHDCGEIGTRLYETLNLIGVGTHGMQYAEVTAREARWSKDMPAYKRFRDKGFQPPQIDGCDHLEATAQNELEIKSMGRISVPDSVAQSSMADAKDILAGRL